MSAVNLLKSDQVEAYRAHIYSNNPADKGDGVPTVGNGLALVVKGEHGWVVRPQSMYDALPFEKLKTAADLLNDGKLSEARKLFGTGEPHGFSLTPAQADRLAASYVIRNITPAMVQGMGGAEQVARLKPGEFAAIAAKLYQKPGWLSSVEGKKFLEAWQHGDAATAKAALGTGMRSHALANAYDSKLSTTNSNLTVQDDAATLAGAHRMHTPAKLDELGNQIYPAQTNWVMDEQHIADLRNNAADPRRVDANTAAPTASRNPNPHPSLSATQAPQAEAWERFQAEGSSVPASTPSPELSAELSATPTPAGAPVDMGAALLGGDASTNPNDLNPNPNTQDLGIGVVPSASMSDPPWLEVYRQRAAELVAMQKAFGNTYIPDENTPQITPYEQGKQEAQTLAVPPPQQQPTAGLRF